MLARLAYWLGMPARLLYQALHNGHGILRVFDILWLRPLPAGLVPLDHPWVTGRLPGTDETVWPRNVIYRTPRPEGLPERDLATDAMVLVANGKFLAARVRQSAIVPEVPLGPRRRMPHGINYIHGASHYNSGLLIFNDLRECYRHITDPAFSREVHRFVRRENREVLFLFRSRAYDPKDFAYFSCCMRVIFPWFCNPNGPADPVLWGNHAPYPAANLITGRWVNDVYTLKRPGGADRVVRPPIPPGIYFQGAYGTGRDHPLWPEKLLARLTHWRVRVRGNKGGMFFVDRRRTHADEIANKALRGQPDTVQASMR